jgi:hypothetical protein
LVVRLKTAMKINQHRTTTAAPATWVRRERDRLGSSQKARALFTNGMSTKVRMLTLSEVFSAT